MTQYRNDWIGLSNKIKYSLELAKSLMILINPSADSYNSISIVKEYSFDCFADIKKYQENYYQHLPAAILERFKSKLPPIEDKINSIVNNKVGRMSEEQLIINITIALSSFEREITFLLSDTQENIRKSTEVAFAHLKRLILVDAQTREKWQNAWKQGKNEEFFESAGGIHLLWHKIWAFKAHSEKERTDLVVKETINQTDPLYRSAEGLVLTEWKKVADPNQIESFIKKAKMQASKYKGSSLASLELANYSYLIMVSRDEIEIEETEFKELDHIYRIINIACFPKTPSGGKITNE